MVVTPAFSAASAIAEIRAGAVEAVALQDLY